MQGNESLERLQVDEMEVGAVSLVQNGAVPDSNGFLIMQMAEEDEGDLGSICEPYIEVIQESPEPALQMAAIDSLATALRAAVFPENVAQSAPNDYVQKIAGWDTWQGWQEHVAQSVHTQEEAIAAIDELAALQKSEIGVVEQSTPPPSEEKEPDVNTEQNDTVAQALAAIEQSEQALAQARVALGSSNKLAPGDSPDLVDDQKKFSEMTGEHTEDNSDDDDDGDTEDSAGADLDEATDGDNDLALSTRDAAESDWQDVKKTNTVVPPAAAEAAHPRTCPTCDLPMADRSAVKGPGSNAVDAHLVNQGAVCQGHEEEINGDQVLQEAESLLADLTPVERTAPPLWGSIAGALGNTIERAGSAAEPVTQSTSEHELLQQALARIQELESRPRQRPVSRQSDSEPTQVAQSAAAGLWDNLIP